MKKVWQVVTAIKNTTGNLLFIAVIIFVIVAMVSQESESIPASAVMIVDPEGVIVEQLRSVEPIEEFLRGQESENAETHWKAEAGGYEAAEGEASLHVAEAEASMAEAEGVAQGGAWLEEPDART